MAAGHCVWVRHCLYGQYGREELARTEAEALGGLASEDELSAIRGSGSAQKLQLS